MRETERAAAVARLARTRVRTVERPVRSDECLSLSCSRRYGLMTQSHFVKMSILLGFSSSEIQVFEKRAIIAPSTTRWSADQLTCARRHASSSARWHVSSSARQHVGS
eukprot:939724-Pleurochrysis_carterae.AAC.4